MPTITIPTECRGSWFGSTPNEPSRPLPLGEATSYRKAERLAWYAEPGLEPTHLAAGLAAVPALESLELREVRIDEALARRLAAAPALESLTLAKCALEAGAFEALCGSTTVQHLSLQETPASDAQLAAVDALPLRSLILHSAGDGLSDAGFAPIARLGSLLSLHLRSLPRFTGSALATIAQARALHTLALEWLPALDGARHLPTLTAHGTLTQLWLEHLDKVGDEAFAVAASIPRMKSLQLRGCKRVTDAGLALLHGHPGLELVALPSSRYGKKISGKGIDALRAANPKVNVYRA